MEKNYYKWATEIKFDNNTINNENLENWILGKRSYLQSFKKFLQVKGHLSVYKSTTISPKLVTIRTDMDS